MPAINMHEAKTQFSSRWKRWRDEEIAIAEAGKSAARMLPVQAGSRSGNPAC